MNAHDREVDVVEELMVKLDRHAGVEEHHHLLLPVLLDECVQNEEPLVSWAHQVGWKGHHRALVSQVFQGIKRTFTGLPIVRWRKKE